MADKRKIKQLLSRNLSGKEIARLILQTCADAAVGREPAFTDAELERAMHTLTGRPRDIDAYNAWIEAARILDHTRAEAREAGLIAENKIERNLKVLHQMTIGFLYRAHIGARPVVMTEKQAEIYVTESRKRQKKRLLEASYSIRQVFEYRAFALAPRALLDKVTADPDYEANVNEWELLRGHGQRQATALAEKAFKELTGLVQKGVLTFRVEGLTQAMETKWPEPFEEARMDKEGRWPLDRKWIRLEALMCEDAPEADQDLVDESCCPGQRLYKAKLPEWRSYFESYTPDLREDLPYGRQVAIIQDPPSRALDKDGNYLFPDPEPVPRLEAFCKTFEDEKGQELIRLNLQGIKAHVKTFLAKKTVIEAFCEAVGVDFTVQLDEWLNDLRRAAEEYSDALDILYRIQAAKEGRFLLGEQAKPRPPELNIDHLKPTKAAVREIKERLDGNLGAEWFDDASDYLRTKTVEEEASGEDSQIQEDAARRIR